MIKPFTIGSVLTYTLIAVFGNTQAIPINEPNPSPRGLETPEVVVIEKLPEDNLQCLAITIYQEARGEDEAAKLAMGETIKHRVMSNRWPHTICGVVQQEDQFAGWNPEDPNYIHSALVFSKMGGNQIERDAMMECYDIAVRIMEGRYIPSMPQDVYHFHSGKKPSWAYKLTFHRQIGGTKFYTGV